MPTIKEENGTLRIIFAGRTVLTHSAELPFIIAGTGGIKCKSSHGSFSVKKQRGAAASLTEYAVNGSSVEFYNAETRVRLDFTERNGILYADIASLGAAAANLSFCFDSHKDEMFFGGGEQFRKLNFKGEKVINLVSEHISIMPIAEKTVFKRIKKYRVRQHSQIKTYSPMSTFVSGDRYALRFFTNAYGEQDFTSDDKSVFTYWGCPERFCYIAGDSFKEISEKLSKDTSSNPYLPDWAHKGMILGIQGGISAVRCKAAKMLESGARVSGVWCQDWSGKKITAAGSQVYWNWEADDVLYPNLSAEISELKKKGVHFLAYTNPYLIAGGRIYEECKQRGFLIKNREGGVYHIKSTTFNAGMLDLTNPDAVTYYKDILVNKNMLSLGIDGYMADFGEYLPTDCVLFDGDAGALHNYWPVLWAKINRDAVRESGREREIFFFTRSGYNGAQQFAPIMWNGDQHTDFTADYGLPCVIPASINLGLSGVTAVHSDIGGFISFRSLKRDAELFIRWLELSAFSPLMRTHETIAPKSNLQFDSPEVIEFSVRFSIIRAKLEPYIKRCMDEASRGIPVMRAPFYEFNDMSLYTEDYVYMLGGEVLAAPVVSAGATVRELTVPDGEWVHLLTGQAFFGGRQKISAPLGVPVVLYKKNSVYKEIFESCKII